MITPEERVQIDKWEEMPTGSRVEGFGDTIWWKDVDGLWASNGVIRVNSIALLSYSKQYGFDASEEEATPKLKKGISEEMSTLFD